MTDTPPQPTLEFYRRDDCEPCEEARVSLQIVLEERVMRENRIPKVRYVDVSESSDLETRFGSRVPVLKIGSDELSLKVSRTSISTFLDNVLGRVA